MGGESGSREVGTPSLCAFHKNGKNYVPHSFQHDVVHTRHMKPDCALGGELGAV